MKELKFKAKEVLTTLTEDNFGTQYIKETVVNVGKGVEHYKIGDEVLINTKAANSEFKWKDKKYIKIDHEGYIICQVDGSI